MVKLKYSALYTDNLGCEQVNVYFNGNGFQFKIRNCILKSDNLNFDFYADNAERISQLFYFKDDELIEYVIDIKIPYILIDSNKELVKEFLLRVERQKNYYNNSLSLFLEGEVFRVEGYDLQELFIKMKEKLPNRYSMESSISRMFGVNYLNSVEVDAVQQSLEEEMKTNSGVKSCLNLLNGQYNKKHQRVPIQYIPKEYCIG